MSELALRVENLGKLYKIGQREPYYALRDRLSLAITAPFRYASSQVRKLARSKVNPSNLKTQPSNLQTFEPSNGNYIWALKEVSFEVKHGEVVGLIGRNGAGKSTLLKILARITEPTEGYAEIYGKVGSLLEVGTGFHPELTGRENIYLSAAILGMKKREINYKFDEIVAFAEVEKFVDTPVKRYSSGMYIRLAFAVAAHLEPEILLVDEVLAVGDVAFQKKCLGKMGEVAREGRTVIFVSHNMASIQALCDLGILLEKGSILRVGLVGDVVDQYFQGIKEKTKSSNGIFPIYSSSHDIGIEDCVVELTDDLEGHFSLKVTLKVNSSRSMRNIGIGLSFTSLQGIKVSNIAPAVTNYVIEEINGECQCEFVCQQVDRYLAGGEYILGVWLAKPKVERLLHVEEVAVIMLPSRDVFSSGEYFEARRYGFVPLPFNFSVLKPVE
jgi:lipopolysaccharide transport system ATP-binding protein